MCETFSKNYHMATALLDLWTLIRQRPEIDPWDLAMAIAEQAAEKDLDYRTRLLIRDGVEALRIYWGASGLEKWLSGCPQRSMIEAICRENYDEVGFPSLKKRIMDKTNPEGIRQYLEHLGREIFHSTSLHIGGSVALLIPGFISRHTEDIDVVGEIPAEIRNKHKLLDDLERLHGLHLGHVQSHYFPSGWETRVHSLGIFGHLQVYLVDEYDVFLSKLFSARLKDMEDLKVLVPQLDKERLVRRLKDTTTGFLVVDYLKEMAQKNWQILFGEPLPS